MATYTCPSHEQAAIVVLGCHPSAART